MDAIGLILVTWAVGLGLLVLVFGLLGRTVRRRWYGGVEGPERARRTLVLYSLASMAVLGIFVWRTRAGVLWWGPPPWASFQEVRTAFRVLGVAAAFLPLYALSVLVLLRGKRSPIGNAIVRAGVWVPLLVAVLALSTPGCGAWVGCIPLGGLLILFTSDPLVILATLTAAAAVVIAIPAERALAADTRDSEGWKRRVGVVAIASGIAFPLVVSLAPERMEVVRARAKDLAPDLLTAESLWVRPIGDPGCQWGEVGAVSPNGTVYVTMGDGLTAVSRDGELLWRAPEVRGLEAPVVGPTGVIYARASRSSPSFVAVAPDGRYLDTVATVIVHRRADRDRRPLGPAVGPDGALVLTGGGAITAYEPTGGVRARRDFGGSRVGDGWALSGPVFDSDGRLRVLNRSTRILHAMTQGLEPADPPLRLGSAGGYHVTPGPDGRVLVRSSPGALTAYDREGRRVWRYEGAVRPPVVAADGRVWAVQEAPFGRRGHQGVHLVALARDGTRRWLRVLPPDGKFAGGVQAGPLLLADGSVLTVVRNVLSSIDSAGEYAWSMRLDEVPWKGAGSGVRWATVGPDGTVFVLAEDDVACVVLHAIRPPGDRPPGLAVEGWPTSLGSATNGRRYGGGQGRPR